MDTPGLGDFGTKNFFWVILWGHEFFEKFCGVMNFFWVSKHWNIYYFLIIVRCCYFFSHILFLCQKFRFLCNIVFRTFILLLFGLSFEKKPILLPTFRIIWAKFQDFTISRFWDMATSWKKGNNFFSVYPIFRPF